MSESVVSRLRRIALGLANNIVDAAESGNPEAILNQSLRDIDRVIDEVTVDANRLRATVLALDNRSAALQQESRALKDQIATALAEGREDLARSGIGRQIDIETQLESINLSRIETIDEINDRTGIIDTAQASRREVLHQITAHRSARRTTEDVRTTGFMVRDPSRTVNQTLRAVERVTGVPTGTASQDASNLAELESLNREQKITERLAAFRKSA